MSDHHAIDKGGDSATSPSPTGPGEPTQRAPAPYDAPIAAAQERFEAQMSAKGWVDWAIAEAWSMTFNQLLPRFLDNLRYTANDALHDLSYEVSREYTCTDERFGLPRQPNQIVFVAPESKKTNPSHD